VLHESARVCHVCQGLANFSEGQSLLAIVMSQFPGGSALNDSENTGIYKYHDIIFNLTQVGPGTKAERGSVSAPMSWFLEHFVYTIYEYRGIKGNFL
jgi:hypothetical protein